MYRVPRKGSLQGLLPQHKQRCGSVEELFKQSRIIAKTGRHKPLLPRQTVEELLEMLALS